MGELYEPYPKLPKNIRQIGERDDIVRVYVEDYVNTYLKRLFPAGGQDLRAGILLGSTEEHGGLTYVFIDGALEMEGITEEGEKVAFSEEAWKKAYQQMEDMFPKRTVQGWFLCGVPGCLLSPLNYWKQHSQYFSGKHKLMYLNSGLEGEEALYITSSDGFYKLRGHCIYYERNQMMQDYMVSRKDVQRVEAGGSDPVIRDFRRKMEKKKEIADSQSHTISFLRGMCACLAILALAGGVAAFNSAEKMKDMEAVMASALPVVSDAGKEYLARAGIELNGLAGTDTTKEGETPSRSSGSTDSSKIIVEEAPGGIFPTAAAPAEGSAGQEEVLSWQQDSALPAGEGALFEGATDGQEIGDAASTGEGQAGGANEGQAAGGARVNAAGERIDTDGAAQEAAAGQAAAGQAVAGQAAAEQAAAGQVEAGQEGDSQAEKDEEPQATEAFASRQLEPEPGQGVYVVQPGETLYGICFKLYQNLSKIDEICQINGLEDIDMLEAGRRLIVP